MIDGHRQDKEFAAFARARLEASVQVTDELTAARLRAARLRALEQARPRRAGWMEPWLWLPAGAAGLAAVAAVAWILVTQPPTLSAAVEMQVLTAEEDLDFYRDLEFYLWLDTHDAPV